MITEAKCRGAMGSGVNFINTLLNPNEPCIHIKETNEYVLEIAECPVYCYVSSKWVFYKRGRDKPKLSPNVHTPRGNFKYCLVGEEERHRLLYNIKRRLAGLARIDPLCGADDFRFPGWMFNSYVAEGMKDLQQLIKEEYPSHTNMNIPMGHVGHLFIRNQTNINKRSFDDFVKHQFLYQMELGVFKFEPPSDCERIELGKPIPKSLERFTDEINNYHQRNNKLIETFYEEFNW